MLIGHMNSGKGSSHTNFDLVRTLARTLVIHVHWIPFCSSMGIERDAEKKQAQIREATQPRTNDLGTNMIIEPLAFSVLVVWVITSKPPFFLGALNYCTWNTFAVSPAVARACNLSTAEQSPLARFLYCLSTSCMSFDRYAMGISNH